MTEKIVKSWTKLIGTAGYDYASDLEISADNYIYISGRTDGNLDTQFNNGYDDAFLNKLDFNGNIIWSKLIGSNQWEDAPDIEIDKDGYLYITGSRGVPKKHHDYDAYLSKIDTDGNEGKILQGASKTLKSPSLNAIILEMPLDQEEYCVSILSKSGFKRKTHLNKASRNQIWLKSQLKARILINLENEKRKSEFLIFYYAKI